MENYIIDFITNYGYLAVFLLILIENIFPPIPSEVVLTFGGFMTTQTSLHVLGVIVVATLASYLGAVILYYIGYILQPTKFERLLNNNFVKKLGFKIENIEKAQSWFNHHGKSTVFLCRLVPVIRSLISIPAGMAKMNFIVFSIWTMVGTLLWNTILVYIGKALGNNWSEISVYVKEYAIVIAVLVVILLIGYFIYKRKKAS